MTRRALPLLILLAASAGAPSLALPGGSEVRGELQQTRSQLRLERKRLDVVNDKEQDLARQLQEARQGADESRAVVAETASRLASANVRWERIRDNLEANRIQLERSRRALSQRLRQVYMEGEVGYLVVLLGSDNFTDLLDHARYLTRILASDRRLLARVRREKAELESQEQAARALIREIESLRATHQERLTRLSQTERRRASLLEEVRAQRRSIASYVVELEVTTQELEASLQRLLASQQATPRRIPRGTGRFLWPASGPISSVFGYRVHPISGTLRMHTGLDIAAPTGTPIRAVDAGVVIHSGWYGGYGNCLILDHGGGTSTLYAHCDRLLAGSGQSVRQGQTIATVGSTGNSTGPHLHFEVRLGGHPVDPQGFL